MVDREERGNEKIKQIKRQTQFYHSPYAWKNHVLLTLQNTTCVWHCNTQLVFDAVKHFPRELKQPYLLSVAEPRPVSVEMFVVPNEETTLYGVEELFPTACDDVLLFLTGCLVDSTRFDNRATCGTPGGDVLGNLAHAWRGGSTCCQFWCSIPIVPRLLNIPFRWKVRNDCFWFKKCHYLLRDVGEDLASLHDTMRKCKSYLIVKWKVQLR